MNEIAVSTAAFLKNTASCTGPGCSVTPGLQLSGASPRGHRAHDPCLGTRLSVGFWLPVSGRSAGAEPFPRAAPQYLAWLGSPSSVRPGKEQTTVPRVGYRFHGWDRRALRPPSLLPATCF